MKQPSGPIITKHWSLDICLFSIHIGQTITSATYTKVLGGLKDIVVDEQVITKEIKLVLHVLEKTTDKSGQVNDMGRLVLFKDSLSVLWLSVRA